MANYLIIGASSGIGKQLAIQLADAGHQVYATYFNNITEDSLISYQRLNVLDETISLEGLPESIEGLVSCPGTINLKPSARIQPADFVQDFHLQFTGAINVLQSVLPKLKDAAQASVVLYSTVAVQTGLSFHTQVATSKGAIEGLSRALAAEWAPKIRVNCIAPSLTDTPLAASLLNTEQKAENNAQRHPMKRIGTAEDIANISEFLLSGKAGWITGQVIHVDGGLSTLKL
ncbi:MAG: SDR family oxidoreductase [Chitinophagaceae bacterium]|nr:SDR family oxidoreductase [Chitinophagaceae bacterium]